MDKCFEEMIYLFYLDNELEKDERDVVDQHLQLCKKCRMHIDKEINNNQKICESFNSGHEPESLIKRVSERVYAQKKFPKISFKWALAAAAAIFIIFSIHTLIIKKKVLFIEPSGEEQQILISSANIEGELAKPHLFMLNDVDKKYIWLEKNS